MSLCPSLASFFKHENEIHQSINQSMRSLTLIRMYTSRTLLFNSLAQKEKENYRRITNNDRDYI